MFVEKIHVGNIHNSRYKQNACCVAARYTRIIHGETSINVL